FWQCERQVSENRHYPEQSARFGAQRPSRNSCTLRHATTESDVRFHRVGGIDRMAQGLIYIVDANGDLQRMTPSAPKNEDTMQSLVARHPELITDGDGDLLLIQRELSISDGEENGGRWSLDHLFVTRDAIPVLVELKRAVDTRLRREVVG